MIAHIDTPTLAGRGQPAVASRRSGVMLAGVTAVISGVAVFVNGEGVKRFPDATVYTTAKNLIAVAILFALWVLARRPAGGLVAPTRRLGPAERVGVVLVGVFGGGVAFVLFFEGLSSASSTHAAFVQKTLVVWVALLAVPLLRERLSALHVVAIGLLVTGQVALDHGLSGFRVGRGEVLILGATLLWAAEVVVAKRLLRAMPSLTLALARLGIGVIVLVAWVVLSGRWEKLAGLGAPGWWWALLTGVVLAAYVATWFSALARAQAVDVAAVLVGAAIVTALLDATAHGRPLAPVAAGLGLLAAGTSLVVVAALRPLRRALVVP